MVPFFQHSGMTQRLDEKVIGKIEELVGEGVRSVDEMRRHLKIYNKDDLFRDKEQPQRSNRRYFLRSKTIKNHMYNAAMRARLSVMDQDTVQELIKKWKFEKGSANDKFYFRPYIKGSAEFRNTELSAYKTTKYSLPLFFIAVKTNVDYIIVASFIVQDETTASITEALSILCQWNPQWKPWHMMTDLCEEEINSIESVFQGKYNLYLEQTYRIICLGIWLVLYLQYLTVVTV